MERAVAGEVYAKADNDRMGRRQICRCRWSRRQISRATASGGGRLLGVEVAAEASVKVGMSAKFEVGFDVAQSQYRSALGIGFDINVSIDFSKVGSVIKDIGKVIVILPEPRRLVQRW